MRRHILNTCPKIWIATAAITVTFIIVFFNTGCHRGNGIKPEQVRVFSFNAIRLDQEDLFEIGLDSMTFLSGWFPSGTVTFSHGEYREPAAPGSASEIVVKLTDKRAFGLIHGRETGAVVLVTDSGGSGTFYDLALLLKKAEGWVNTDTILLGDRVKIQAMEIKNDRIIIKMIKHGPEDPMCCPTLEVVKIFSVKENKLVPVPDELSKKYISGIIRPDLIPNIFDSLVLQLFPDRYACVIDLLQ